MIPPEFDLEESSSKLSKVTHSAYFLQGRNYNTDIFSKQEEGECRLTTGALVLLEE